MNQILQPAMPVRGTKVVQDVSKVEALVRLLGTPSQMECSATDIHGAAGIPG